MNALVKQKLPEAFFTNPRSNQPTHLKRFATSSQFTVFHHAFR
jgi:hypothetical protein